MIDSADKATIDLFQGQEKRRGRPVTGTAKTNAERMRAYRKNRKEQGVRVVVQRPADLDQLIDDESNLYRQLEVLRQERDEALKRVAEFEQQLEVEVITNSGLTRQVDEFKAITAQLRVNHKAQATKHKNEKHKLTECIGQLERNRDLAVKLLNGFLDECRDYASVMPPESWVNSVRSFLFRELP